MNITKATYNSVAGTLILEVPASAGFRFLANFKSGEYEITPAVKKRSLNANSYAWMLMTRIADKIGIAPEDVYWKEMHEIAGRQEIIRVRNDVADAFRRTFLNGYLGRDVVYIGGDDEWSDLKISYGSSDFDTYQMCQLVDKIIQDCEQLGIEYDNGKMASLLEQWNG